MIPLLTTLFCCALFLAQLVFILAACQTAKRVSPLVGLCRPAFGPQIEATHGLTNAKPEELCNRTDKAVQKAGDRKGGTANPFAECTPAPGRILKAQIRERLRSL